MDNKGWGDMFSSPRLSAEHARALISKSQEAIGIETRVETILNNILEGVVDCVDDYLNGTYDKMYMSVSLEGDLSADEKIIVINRLKDLGYLVLVNFETEEEVEHMKSLEELAKEDTMVDEVLNEMYFAQDTYLVSWEYCNCGNCKPNE